MVVKHYVCPHQGELLTVIGLNAKNLRQLLRGKLLFVGTAQGHAGRVILAARESDAALRQELRAVEGEVRAALPPANETHRRR